MFVDYTKHKTTPSDNFQNLNRDLLLRDQNQETSNLLRQKSCHVDRMHQAQHRLKAHRHAFSTVHTPGDVPTHNVIQTLGKCMHFSYPTENTLQRSPSTTRLPFGSATAIQPLQNTTLLVRHSHASAPLSHLTSTTRLGRKGNREKSYAQCGDNRRTARVLIPSRGNKVARELGSKRSAATNLSRRVKGTG